MKKQRKKTNEEKEVKKLLDQFNALALPWTRKSTVKKRIVSDMVIEIEPDEDDDLVFPY